VHTMSSGCSPHADATVLITNDDGYAAEGLRLLRRALMGAGLQTVTIAPDSNRSATGRRITVHGTVSMRRVYAEDDPIWACDGTPTDCVRLGILSDAFPTFDLVVSGANHGSNLGDDVHYSGTVSAAAEAAALGLPAIAVSQCGPDLKLGFLDEDPHAFHHLDFVAALARRLVTRILLPEVCLNVNLPADRATGAPRWTTLGRRAWCDARVTTTRVADGTLAFTPWASDAPAQFEPGTDFEALRHGKVSVTPLLVRAGLRDVGQSVLPPDWTWPSVSPALIEPGSADPAQPLVCTAHGGGALEVGLGDLRDDGVVGVDDIGDRGQCGL
jgi:5'-nucleotidase